MSGEPARPLMLACYALEPRGARYVLGFAIARALGSAYGFLQGACSFGLGPVHRGQARTQP